MELMDKVDMKLNILDDVLVKLNFVEQAVNNLGTDHCGELSNRGKESSARVRRPTAANKQVRGRGRGLGQRIPKPIIRDHETVIMVPTDEDHNNSTTSDRPSNLSKQMNPPLTTTTWMGSSQVCVQSKQPIKAFNPSPQGRLGKVIHANAYYIYLFLCHFTVIFLSLNFMIFNRF